MAVVAEVVRGAEMRELLRERKLNICVWFKKMLVEPSKNLKIRTCILNGNLVGGGRSRKIADGVEQTIH